MADLSPTREQEESRERAIQKGASPLHKAKWAEYAPGYRNNLDGRAGKDH